MILKLFKFSKGHCKEFMANNKTKKSLKQKLSQNSKPKRKNNAGDFDDETNFHDSRDVRSKKGSSQEIEKIAYYSRKQHFRWLMK